MHGNKPLVVVQKKNDYMYFFIHCGALVAVKTTQVNACRRARVLTHRNRLLKCEWALWELLTPLCYGNTSVFKVRYQAYYFVIYFERGCQSSAVHANRTSSFFFPQHSEPQWITSV